MLLLTQKLFKGGTQSRDEPDKSFFVGFATQTFIPNNVLISLFKKKKEKAELSELNAYLS